MPSPSFMPLELHLHNNQTDLSIDLKLIEQVVPSILKFHDLETDELTLQFISDEEMCRLHEEYFDDPSSTDCITFPVDGAEPAFPGEPHVLGEVFLCPLTAVRYAAEHQLDPYEELLLYIVHGILHLKGLDDIEEDDRQLMRKEEARTLQYLKEHALSIRPRSSI